MLRCISHDCQRAFTAYKQLQKHFLAQSSDTKTLDIALIPHDMGRSELRLMAALAAMMVDQAVLIAKNDSRKRIRIRLCLSSVAQFETAGSKLRRDT